MSTFNFVVEGERVRIVSKRSVEDIINNEPIHAEFSFSPDWDEYSTRVVGFYNRVKRECPPQVLKNGIECNIPEEAFGSSIFYVQVLGMNSEHDIRKTDKCAICWLGR